MTALLQNFDIHAGDDLVVPVTATKEVDQSALDLTGAAVTWKLARQAGGPALIEKTATEPVDANGIRFTNAAGGLLEVDLVPADTVALAPGCYVHEVRIVDTFGKVSTLTTGTVTVLAVIQAPSAPEPAAPAPRDAATRLLEVDQAISKILKHGQSFETSSGRKLTRADLKTLLEQRQGLEAEVARSTRSGARVRTVTPCF
jgi:hypothetical protein